MSKHNRHRPSHGGEQNAPTTVPIEASPPPPIQEKTMEATQEKTMPEVPEAAQLGPTAKEMAAAEETNQLRMRQLAEQAAAAPPPEAVPIADVAARGYDALHEQFRRHNEAEAKKKAYIPPPRTERQMSALEEELEAGRRTQQRAEAQLAASRPTPVDANKEGFTTPVYRPGDVVPDPVTGKLGAYGTDAP